MAKFQVKAMLLAPSEEGYTQETDPKAYGDYQIIETAYEYENMAVIMFVLDNYRYEGGAIEEHETDGRYIIECSEDGYTLLERIE